MGGWTRGGGGGLKTSLPPSLSGRAIHMFAAHGLDYSNSLYFAVDQSLLCRLQPFQNAGCGTFCLGRDNTIISHLLWLLFTCFLSLSALTLDFTAFFKMATTETLNGLTLQPCVFSNLNAPVTAKQSIQILCHLIHSMV